MATAFKQVQPTWKSDLDRQNTMFGTYFNKIGEPRTTDKQGFLRQVIPDVLYAYGARNQLDKARETERGVLERQGAFGQKLATMDRDDDSFASFLQANMLDPRNTDALTQTLGSELDAFDARREAEAARIAQAEKDKGDRASRERVADTRAAATVRAAELGAGARVDAAGTRADATVEAAEIGAGSRRDVADTAADASRDVAQTNKEGRVESANVAAEASKDVADRRAEASENVAGINKDARTESANIAAEASKDVAQTNKEGRVESAEIGADASVESANVSADARRDVADTAAGARVDSANIAANASRDVADTRAAASRDVALTNRDASDYRADRSYDQAIDTQKESGAQQRATDTNKRLQNELLELYKNNLGKSNFVFGPPKEMKAETDKLGYNLPLEFFYGTNPDGTTNWDDPRYYGIDFDSGSGKPKFDEWIPEKGQWKSEITEVKSDPNDRNLPENKSRRITGALANAARIVYDLDQLSDKHQSASWVENPNSWANRVLGDLNLAQLTDEGADIVGLSEQIEGKVVRTLREEQYALNIKDSQFTKADRDTLAKEIVKLATREITPEQFEKNIADARQKFATAIKGVVVQDIGDKKFLMGINQPEYEVTGMSNDEILGKLSDASIRDRDASFSGNELDVIELFLGIDPTARTGNVIETFTTEDGLTVEIIGD